MKWLADRALLENGWASQVLLEIDPQGEILRITPEADPSGAERIAGVVLPGMPNLHSHAFQRAMAGLAERRERSGDDFWTWRRVMYGFVEQLSPDEVEAIAAQLFLELLKAGYTSVTEFHYLHHQSDGRPYAEPTAMARAVASAAERIGIGLTLLPTLYQTGGFGGQSIESAQRRFKTATDTFMNLVESLIVASRKDIERRVGVALHSLRAVPPTALAEVVDAVSALDPAAPIHIHAAEQEKEVRDCLDWSGRRPVEWLLEHAGVDRRWCVIHATHTTSEEARALALSGAVAGLCPSTEANLGDGFFPFENFLASGGAFGIGSDSHVCRNPFEELRWLEYGQRLRTRRRCLAAGEKGHAGAELWRRAARGGAQASGCRAGALVPGTRADLIVVDPEHPDLVGRRDDTLLDSLVLAAGRGALRHVMVGGRWRIRDGAHRGEEEVARDFRRTIHKLARVSSSSNPSFQGDAPCP